MSERKPYNNRRREKTAQVVTRMEEADHNRLKQEASRDGCDVSTFVRMTLRREFQAREQRNQHQAAA